MKMSDARHLKGLFLKVPENTPNLGQLKKWYCSTNPDGVEKIEKYALKNAVIYDYFYDKWIPFEEIVNNIPYEFGGAESFDSQAFIGVSIAPKAMAFT